MTAVSWLDGRWLTHRQARVSVDDRAFLFADGVYEVVSIYRGQFVDADLHLARLRRSLAGLSMRLPLSQAALSVLARELIRRNAIAHGMLYLQVTRGAAPRWHGFPDPAVKSTLLLTAKHLPAPSAIPRRSDHIKTTNDLRWGRCDWKTTGLLANCLALQGALDDGFDGPWLVAGDPDDKRTVVREGASSNAWIITQDGVLVTHPESPQILGGCTRAAILQIASDLQIQSEERTFTIGEALTAREAFNSSSSSYLRPVLSLNGTAIGDGTIGPVTRRLHEAFVARLERGVGLSAGLV